MKKLIVFSLLGCAIGLVIGFWGGAHITHKKMEIALHDSVVNELNKVSKELENAAALRYAGLSFSVSGKFLPEYAKQAEQILWFTADFIVRKKNDRQFQGKLMYYEAEELAKEGKAFMPMYNKEYYVENMKRDAAYIAADRAEQFFNNNR